MLYNAAVTRTVLHDPSPHLTRLEPISRDIERWRLNVPAKPACYLLEDEHHRPILLATVGDLRHALLRRLSETDEHGGKRIDYRELVRYVRWRDVCSRFEADWAYLHNARRLFADDFRKLTRNWRAWWIGIDLEDAHPRFVSRDQPSAPAGHCFGPLPERKLARRCIEALEDIFDLCREHHLLMQTPHAVACSYKQMGRCPAPCDGSITMDAYRDQLRDAVGLLTGDRQVHADRIAQRIREASAELNFELAARLKVQLDHVRSFDHEGLARLAPASQFNYVVLQRGRRKHHHRAFIVTPRRIHFAGEMVKRQRDAQIAYLADLAERVFAADADAEVAPAEMGLVAFHLLGSREEGTFLHCPAGHVDREALAAAAEPDASSPTPR